LLRHVILLPSIVCVAVIGVGLWLVSQYLHDDFRALAGVCVFWVARIGWASVIILSCNSTNHDTVASTEVLDQSTMDEMAQPVRSTLQMGQFLSTFVIGLWMGGMASHPVIVLALAAVAPAALRWKKSPGLISWVRTPEILTLFAFGIALGLLWREWRS